MEDILKDLFGLTYKDVNQFLVKIGTNLVISVAILVIGFWLTNVLSRGLKRVLRKSKTDEGLVTFLSSLVSMTLKVLVLITAFTQLGVEMTSFVAILGAAGLAVGMAFSGTLSNFAGGVMILIFKPFKVGDTILTQGEQGVVKEIQIFNTYLHTSDNKVIILPNGPVANGNITNFTKASKRRVEWHFSLAYGDDIDLAKSLLEKFLAEDKKILKKEEHFIGIGGISNNVVQLIVRAWVKTDDYWDVHFAMNEKVLKAFEEAGLHFPQSVSEVKPKQ